MQAINIKKTIYWGIGLWLIGYILGIVFFAFIPNYLLGWVIMPIGILVTLWVLIKKMPIDGLKNSLAVGAIWTLIAIVFDYVFLVMLFKPADGYYKPDVYLYYLITLVLPVIVGLTKGNKTNE